MKYFRLRRVGSFSAAAPLLAVIAMLLSPGCKDLFVAKHKVLVDAISAPGETKPVGKSYRLVAKRSMVSQTPVQVPVVKACVDAALGGQGLFEPPANVPPDLFIEVTYGRDNAPRADPAARETFLELSARSNPTGSLDRASGPELWDVKVSVLGLAGSIESAMPLLSAVAANYMGGDTRVETAIQIPQSSPMIEAVRTAAIKSLEAKGSPPVGPGASPASGGPPATTEPGKSSSAATNPTSATPTPPAPTPTP